MHKIDWYGQGMRKARSNQNKKKIHKGREGWLGVQMILNAIAKILLDLQRILHARARSCFGWQTTLIKRAQS